MRRDAMKCAMALGLPSLGEPITLVQETTTDVQAGTLPYLPIYRPKAPLFSVADPQQALVGWAYSPLRIGDLIRAALDAPLVRFPGDAEIQVFDGKATTASLLFDSRDPEQRDSALIPGCERRLDICGRPWIQRVGLPTSSHGLWNDLSRCGSWQGEFWNRHRNGQLYRQFLSIISVRNDQGDITNL